jgi:hypothetical protein
MSTSPFDPTVYYRLSNNVPDEPLTLSLNLRTLPPSPLQMTPAGAYSSENWQLFEDSGLYFIRNYDFGSDYQLGVAEDDRSVPRMLNSSGALGMQWKLSPWGDGTWALRNGLLGDLSLFAVSLSGEYNDIAVPAMNLDQRSAHWTADINLSAGRVSGAMLNPIPSVEVNLSISLSLVYYFLFSPSKSWVDRKVSKDIPTKICEIDCSGANKELSQVSSTLTPSSSASPSSTSLVLTSKSTEQPTTASQMPYLTTSTSTSKSTSAPSPSPTQPLTSNSAPLSFSKSAKAGILVGSIYFLIALTFSNFGLYSTDSDDRRC